MAAQGKHTSLSVQGISGWDENSSTNNWSTMTTDRLWQLVDRANWRQLVDDNWSTRWSKLVDKIDQLSVDELSVDELSVDELSVDELSVDQLSGRRVVGRSVVRSTSCRSISCQVDELSVDEFSSHHQWLKCFITSTPDRENTELRNLKKFQSVT